MIFQASHTHLYPGHEGTIELEDPPSAAAPENRCIFAFSDGMAVHGSLRHLDGDDWLLSLGAHTTAAGTDIPAKSWMVSIDQKTDRFRIRGKG